MYSPDLAIEPVVGSPLKITTPPPSKQSHVPLIAVTLCSLTMVREYYCPIKSKLSLIRENKLRMKGTDDKNPTNYNYELCVCLQPVHVSFTFIRMV